MDIPENELSALEDLYSMFPGGVRCVWINRDFSVLSRKMQEREKYVIALEAAETRLIKSATTSFLQRRNRKSALPERLSTKCERPIWERYLEENDRDHQYLPIYGWSWMSAIPFIGRRVDMIHHCLRELTRLNEEIEADQKELIEIDSTGGNSDKYSRMRSAFVRFNSQVAAHMACQTTLSFRPLRALLSQTLSMEARNHEATERALEQERANIQDVIRFLDSIEIPRRAKYWHNLD